MSLQPQHLLFIISDNRGEQDYIKSIANMVKLQSKASNGQLTYSAYLQIKNEDGTYSLKEMADLPATAAELIEFSKTAEKVTPVEIAQRAEENGIKHRIIAGGNNTLNQAVSLQNAIAVGTERLANISYVTHILNENDRSTLFSHWVEFITPEGKDNITKKFAIEPEIVNNRHISVDEVPHSYTLDNCLADLEIFKGYAATEPDSFFAHVMKRINAGEKIALTVLPAGFDKIDKKNPKKHVPYTEIEADKAGEAIGHHLEAGTTMVVIEGGPRNRKDQDLAQQDTMRSYIAGYARGQKIGAGQNGTIASSIEGVPPAILSEEFAFGRNYDTTKVAIALAHLYPDQILALYVSGEGNAMRSAVLQHVDLKKVEAGMLVSKVLRKRGDDLKNDQNAGLPIVKPIRKNKVLGIRLDLGEGKEHTQVVRNPAKAVMNALKL